jgi:hypothetical protein
MRRGAPSSTFLIAAVLAAVVVGAGCASDTPNVRTPDAARDTASPPADAGSPDGPAADTRPADVAVEAGPVDTSQPTPDAGEDDGGVIPEPDAGEDDGGAGGGMPDSGPDLPPVQGPLLGYWPLDEATGTTTADKSANGGDGTLAPGATWTTSGFPVAQFPNPGAVVLDGVSGFVELGVRAVPRNEAPKTVSLWFFQDAPSTAAGRKNIIALTNLEENGTQIGLDAGRVSVWFEGDPVGLVTAATAAAAGWHHIAYTYDGTTNRLYADGTLVGEMARAALPAQILHARLGAFDLVGMEMFGGRVDDVRIYDHALDAAAIGLLATGQMPP